jgi:hypothetical protein
MEQPGQAPDRRLEPRTSEVSSYRAEFKFSGMPIYQLKLRDLSNKGAGIVARADSKFLRMIQIGQELEVRLVKYARAEGLHGRYKSRIAHISEVEEGRFRGHAVVGISFHGSCP